MNITKNLTFRVAAAGFIFAFAVTAAGGGALGIARADDTATTTPDTATTTPPIDTGTTTVDLAAAATSTDPGTDASTTPPQTQVATSTDGTGGQSLGDGGTIVTGDATATTTVDNELDSNITSPDQVGETNSSTITASSTNDGVLESAATSSAATGDNTATGGDSASTIVTGDAVATANVINEVNTNIFNSDGLILFLNQLFGGGFNLNLYDLSYFFVGGPGASPYVLNSEGQPKCTLLTCLNSSNLNVFNDNTATVTNSVIVRASTGNNVASSTGDATVDTGNAYAAANVVNLVNTNIVNSSYLLLSFNNFGDLTDNITLPGNNFFSRLFASGEASTSMNSSTYTVNNVNDVNLTGTTTADATTGNNAASTTTDLATSTQSGSGVVTTGNAYSSANTFNQANTNQVGGTSVFMLFRVAGNWNGHIIGLPAGISETIVPDGTDQLIELVSGNGTTTPAAADLLQKYNSSRFTAIATSTASVDNTVNVSADTGQNQATTGTGTSTVSTGNAYASASVVNLINTNIVGQNWIFAVFNIFGNLDGDIVFSDGSPNLSLAAAAAPGSVTAGGDATYTFTVTNSGDADANNVTLNATFDNTLLSFVPGAEPVTPSPTGESWQLGAIPRGQSRTFAYTAHVGTNFPAGQSATVPLTAAAVNNDITSPAASNTAGASIVVNSPLPAPSNSGGGGGGGGGGPIGSFGSSGAWSADPVITIVNTADTSTTTVPATVGYKVEVTNDKNAGGLYNSALVDTLYDPSGNAMYHNSWALDTVAPGDDITLTFSVQFASTSVPGIYHNVVQVTGNRGNSGAAYNPAGQMKPFEASVDVQLLPSGLVLGVATSSHAVIPTAADNGSCSAVITTYLRPGSPNTGQVAKLQQFLNGELGAGLPVTGYFGPMTTRAVNAFQRKYAGDILAPLGIAQPTGAVYASTQRKINALACGSLGTLIQQAVQLGVSAAQTSAPAPAPKKPKTIRAAPAPAPVPSTTVPSTLAPASGGAESSGGWTQWAKNLLPFL